MNMTVETCAAREGVASLCSSNLKEIREIAAMTADVRRCVAGAVPNAAVTASPPRASEPSLWDQLQEAMVILREVRTDLDAVLNDVRLPGIHKPELRR